LTIDCTGLPSLRNAKSIMTGPGSRKRAEVLWEISPEVGIDSLRAELRGRSFSNAELVSFLDAFFAEHDTGKIVLFFSHFHPGEDVERLRTRAFIARLLRRFLRQIETGQLEICSAPLSTDPASPIQRGLARGIRSFVDRAESYVRQMLAWRHSFGNFLAHVPTGLSQDEAMLLALFFRYETELHTRSPQGYLHLVRCFRSFEAFDAYLRGVFERFLLEAGRGVDDLHRLAARFQHGSPRRFRRALTGLYARQLFF
jgi:hypothetical protein